MPITDAQSMDKDDTIITPRLGKSSPILSYFCVYNPSLGQSEENTKDQILYYTAKKAVPADVKMKQVGLAQALVNFTFTFSPSQPTQNVHSQKNRLVFLQPEPGFWMHMCIELGILRKQIKDAKGKEKLVTEYLDAELDDSALEAVLKIGYEQFKLLNGNFSSILYGSSDKPTRQRTRSLMHAIEEFFSDWIWKWDFDRLYTMCFTAVFNGVPIQPVLRANYLRVHELDQSIQAKYDISHIFALNLDDGALVYRSPDLSIKDVRGLRKYVLKRVDQHSCAEKRKTDLELASAMMKKDAVSGLKQFTKSLSQSHILSYFSSGGSKSTEAATSSTPNSAATSIESTPNLPVSTLDIPTAPSSPSGSPIPDPNMKQGTYLTGLLESTAIGMDGQERPVSKCDLVRVYISSPYNDHQTEQLTQYYLLLYKHKSNLLWSFLLPATSKTENLLSDLIFYNDLETHMNENNLEELTKIIKDNINNIQEKSLNLGKNYQCFYYDNTTLNMKSTMIDLRAAPSKDKKGPASVTNDMLLQLLEVRQDFGKFPHTNEVYTRSTTNHWIAGNRLYNKLTVEQDDDELSVDDYTEIYLIAAKKDTSLADVEETLTKMSKSLLETMHIE